MVRDPSLELDSSTVRQLSESASSLAVHDPVWMGLAVLATAYALSYWFIKGAPKSKKPVQQVIAGLGGIVIGSLVGFSALFDRTTLDASGAREWRLLSGEQQVAWSDVAEVAVEQRTAGRRGKQPHLVLRGPDGEMAVEISGLSPGEIERVLAFARARARER